jgi:hypothetical protein
MIRNFKIKQFIILTIVTLGVFIIIDLLTGPVFQFVKTGSNLVFKETLRNMIRTRRILIDIFCSAAFSLIYLLFLRKEQLKK